MRVYDQEFKEEATKLSYEVGPKAASEQLGIPQTTLYTWRNRIRQHGDIAFVGSGHKRLDPKTAEARAMEKKIRDLESANDILKINFSFFRREPKEVAARELFKFIWAQRVKDPTKHSVKRMCEVLEVSEPGYYKWLRIQGRPYKYDDLLAKILQIRAKNKDYGAYRIFLDLQLFHGYTGSYYLILKLCRTHHLMLKKKYHAKGLKKADPAVQASKNLIK